MYAVQTDVFIQITRWLSLDMIIVSTFFIHFLRASLQNSYKTIPTSMLIFHFILINFINFAIILSKIGKVVESRNLYLIIFDFH